MFRREQIIISTKERIKKEALSLFAKKGYYGTSISDIADAVGITKSSLYSHYSGKDELFLAASENVVREFGTLLEQLLEASKDMEIHHKLRYNFEEYILYFYRNREFRSFANISLLHVPSDLFEKNRSNYLTWVKPYRKRLEDIFAEGMQQGIIRQGDPRKKVWSFEAKREGAAFWVCVSPDVTEDYIEDFWNDFWFGVVQRNEEK